MLTALKARPYGVNSRNIFPFSMEGCVLYLPLWQEDMQGATLISYDKNLHACTVTGATWGNQGRTFDGIGDIIVSSADIPISTYSAFTFDLWLKRTRDPLTRDIPFSVGYPPFQFNLETAKNYLEIQIDGVYRAFDNLTPITLNEWAHIAITHRLDTGAWIYYINGVQKVSGTRVGSDYRGSSPLRIGNHIDLGQPFQGLFGEARIYSRALSAAEVLNIYNVTKWRY